MLRRYGGWLIVSLIYLATWSWAPRRYEFAHYAIPGTSIHPALVCQEVMTYLVGKELTMNYLIHPKEIWGLLFLLDFLLVYMGVIGLIIAVLCSFICFNWLILQALTWLDRDATCLRVLVGATIYLVGARFLPYSMCGWVYETVVEVCPNFGLDYAWFWPAGLLFDLLWIKLMELTFLFLIVYPVQFITEGLFRHLF